jgi:hypothetical protein
MLDISTFSTLHPTTRKYVEEKVMGEPLPLRLRELVERMRELEPVQRGRDRTDNPQARLSDAR